MKAIIRSRNSGYRFIDELANRCGGEFEKPIQITAKPFKRDRTLDQNAKLHAVIRELALHCGYTESAMKDVLKAEFAPIKSLNLGSRVVDVPRGTSEMNVAEMSDFIERLYQLAAELGVEVG